MRRANPITVPPSWGPVQTLQHWRSQLTTKRESPARNRTENKYTTLNTQNSQTPNLSPHSESFQSFLFVCVCVCVCVCMYIYVYVCICIYVFLYSCMYRHISMHFHKIGLPAEGNVFQVQFRSNEQLFANMRRSLPRLAVY